ncbi:MAG: topoisomerase C-terminal repeat-containing protein [Butyrivibrio sp.]
MTRKKLSEADVKTLIETGKLEKKSGFVSKSGKKFSAGLILENKDVKITY